MTIAQTLTIVILFLVIVFWVLFAWHISRVDKGLQRTYEAQIETNRRLAEEIALVRREIREDMIEVRRDILKLRPSSVLEAKA
jgi:hypothetical protein